MKRSGLIIVVGMMVIVFGSVFCACRGLQKEQELSYIKPEECIKDVDFKAFVSHLNLEQKKLLLLSLCKSEKQKKEIEERTDIPSPESIKQAQWASSHWVTYPFKEFDYHTTVQWVAKKLSLSQSQIESATTFQLEHLICKNIFTKMWDNLSEEEREKVLNEAGYKSSAVSGIITMSGGAALAALCATEAISGFAFYIVVAKTLTAAAGAVFGASAATTVSTIAIFCGPVGWAIAGVALTGGALLVGRADVERSIAFIVQIHYLKIDALKKLGVDPAKYYLEESKI